MSVADFNAGTLNTLASNFQQFVVAPLNAFGLGGFLFDIAGEESAQLTAEITDHYTENNSTVQDHIAVRPRRFILKSYVGELRYTPNSTNNGTLASLTQKLTTISAILPQLSSAETQIAGLATGVAATGVSQNFTTITNAAANIYALVQNTIQPQDHQQQAYAYFKALWQTKTLVSLQTPFEFVNQMAIESIVAVQPEETISVTHFTITLKEIRVATTQVQAATTNGGAPPVATGATSSQIQAQLNAATAGVIPANVAGATSPLPGQANINPVVGSFAQFSPIVTDPQFLKTMKQFESTNGVSP